MNKMLKLILISLVITSCGSKSENKTNTYSETEKLGAPVTSPIQIKSMLQSYNEIDKAVFYNNGYADPSTMERQIFDTLISEICKIHRDPQSTGIGYNLLNGEKCPILWKNEKKLTKWDSQELVGTYNMYYKAFDAKFKTLNDIDNYEFESDVHKKIITGNSLGGRMSFLRNKKGFFHSQIFGKVEVEQLDDLITFYEPNRPTLWDGEKIITLRFANSTEQIKMKFDGLTELYELNGTVLADKELQELLKNF